MYIALGASVFVLFILFICSGSSKLLSIGLASATLIVYSIVIVAYQYWYIEDTFARSIGTKVTDPRFQQLLEMGGINSALKAEIPTLLLNQIWLDLILATAVGLGTWWLTRSKTH